jgi:F5/8 type C domain
MNNYFYTIFLNALRVYLHVLSWPKNGKIAVPFTNKITKAYLLADASTALKVTSNIENSVIQLPHYAPDKISSTVVIHFEGEPKVLPIPSVGKNVTASSSETSEMLKNLTDGDPKSQWRAAKTEKSATLDIDLESTCTIQCLSLSEPWHPWTGIKQEYELQCFNGSDWEKIISGVTDGSGITVLFNPVKSSKFRLILKNEKEEPKLNEMILFRAE